MNFFILLKKTSLTNIKIGVFTLPINMWELFIRLILPIVIGLIIYKLINKGIKRTLNKIKFSNDKKDSVFKWMRFSLRIILIIFIFLLIFNLFGAQITQYLSVFGNVLTKPLVQGISVGTILMIFPILYLSQVIGKLAQKFTEKSLLNYIKLDSGTKHTIVSVVKYITIIFVVLFGLTVIGIDLSLLLGLFGIIGIGIGFGLQGLIGNLFSGLVIIITKPVKVGDHIIVDGNEGNISEIRFLQSILSTITHESIIIPNSKLIENPVHNYSFDDKSIIIKNSIQVSYDTDLDRALELLKTVAEKCFYRLRTKTIETRVVSFDDSGITIAVICWIKDSSNKYAAKSAINLEIWRIFKKESIEIPFPQMDLKIKR